MERIIIRNFGPIKDIDFSLERQFNIIIGEQATGKSTLAKCIYFFKDIIDEFTGIICQPEFVDYTDINEVMSYYYNKIKVKFFSYFGDYNNNKNCFLSFTYKNGNIATLIIENRTLQFQFDEKTEHNIKQIFNNYITSLHKTSNLDETLRNGSVYGFFIRQLFEPYKSKIFLPAGRSKLIGNFNLQLPNNTDKYLIEMLRNITMHKFIFERFDSFLTSLSNKEKKEMLLNLHKIENIKKKILKGKYKYSRKSNKSWIFLDDGTNVPLEYGSSGQQEVLWILNILTMLMVQKRKAFLVIEEPEAHLYPEAQFDLVSLITFIVQDTGSDVLITTHSPYILSSFNLLVYAGKVEGNDSDGIVYNKSRISPLNIGAYKISQGKCKDIFNQKECLIDSDEIDEVSNIINDKFDKLLYKEYKNSDDNKFNKMLYKEYENMKKSKENS